MLEYKLLEAGLVSSNRIPNKKYTLNVFLQAFQKIKTISN